MIINITHLEFNKYIRKHSVGIDLNQIPFLLNFDSDGILLMATLVLESSTIDITIQQANVMIYYTPFIATTTLDIRLFTTSLTEETSSTPTFLSSTTVDTIFLSSTTVDTPFSSSTIVDTIHFISAVPTQTNPTTLLNTEFAYIIGGSTTIVVMIVCCFIIVIFFCCVRCSLQKAQRQNTINGQDRYVATSPFVLLTNPDTTSDIKTMKTTNLDNSDEINIYSLPDDESNNIYEFLDISDKHTLLSSSSRRPAPPPPHHSSRPLPPTPSSKLE